MQAEFEERIEGLNFELNKLRGEHYALIAEHSKKAEQLEAEMENSVNYEYLKNILTSYFSTNDVQVQSNLLRVVFVAMKFSEEEQVRVSEAFNQCNQSLVGRVIGGFF